MISEWNAIYKARIIGFRAQIAQMEEQIGEVMRDWIGRCCPHKIGDTAYSPDGVAVEIVNLAVAETLGGWKWEIYGKALTADGRRGERTVYWTEDVK